MPAPASPEPTPVCDVEVRRSVREHVPEPTRRPIPPGSPGRSEPRACAHPATGARGGEGRTAGRQRPQRCGTAADEGKPSKGVNAPPGNRPAPDLRTGTRPHRRDPGRANGACRGNAANPRSGTGLQHARDPRSEETVEVVRDHEDGTRLRGVATADRRTMRASASSRSGRPRDLSSRSGLRSVARREERRRGTRRTNPRRVRRRAVPRGIRATPAPRRERRGRGEGEEAARPDEHHVCPCAPMGRDREATAGDGEWQGGSREGHTSGNHRRATG
jgi:hypothetical protein